MRDETIAFGPFVLDLKNGSLLRSGTPVRIGGRALEILRMLVAAEGNTVGKDDLLQQIWPNQVVEDNALQAQVSALRRALEHEGDGSYIVTVPGRGYRFVGSKQRSDVTLEPTDAREASPSNRSIAVVPFRNLSSEPEQEYFVDGMVEDIITGLSRIRWLFVIAPNSTFSFKGRSVDVKTIGRELGVRYLLEGSVRKAGDRLRVTVTLVEAETGIHLWHERYDRRLDDIFALQDELTISVVGALEPTLRRIEIERVKRKRPESLDAYDLVLRAMPYAYSHIAADATAAIPLLQKALELEPDYPAAHAPLALSYFARYSRGGLRSEDRAAAIRHARAASAAGDDATALGIAGFVVSLVEHDQPAAIALFDRALSISASNIFALWCSAIALSWMGQTDIAIERAQRALQLSPLDPLNYLAYNALAMSYFQTKRYGEAYEAARHSVRLNANFSVSQSFLVAALIGLGRVEDARLAAQRLLAVDPTFTVERFAVTVAFEPTVFQPFADAWKLAGILQD